MPSADATKIPVIVVKKRRLATTQAPEVESREPELPIPSHTVSPPVSEEGSTGSGSGWTEDYIKASLDKFARCFPGLRPKDGVGACVPLKINIRRDVRAWTESHPEAGLSYDEARCALVILCSRSDYFRRCVPGADRFGLDGEPAGKVNEQGARYVREGLARNATRRKKKAEARAAAD